MINLLSKGSAPSLLSTEKGNELIKAINSLLLGQVSPSDAGKMVFSDGGWVLQLNLDAMKGPAGEKGETGDTGDTGPQGPKGDKGDAGEASYPWIGDADSEGAWKAWLGAGDASFVAEGAAPLSALQILVGAGGTPEFKLTVGDSTAANNGLFFDGGSGNEVQLLWKTPRFQMQDDGGNGVRLDFAGGSPTLLMADVWSSPSSGNQIKLDLATGPEVLLSDDSGSSLSVDINDGPQVYLQDSSGNNIKLDINDGPNFYVGDTDGNSVNCTASVLTMTNPDGDTITIDVAELDGHPLSLQETFVCVTDEHGNKVTKKCLTLRSDPYDDEE